MTNNDPIIALSGNEYSAAIKAMKSATDVINTQQELLKQQSAIIEIMSGYISDNLELFEQLFESDEGFCDASPEKMHEYITIARWMQYKYGRKCIADRVEKHMKELPF
jgi:hypothetical protein